MKVGGVWFRIAAGMLLVGALAQAMATRDASQQRRPSVRALLAASDAAILDDAPHRLGAEPRDARWAFPTEEALTGLFARIPGRIGLPLARCATTVCRITGRLPSAGPERRAADHAITYGAIPAAIRTGRVRTALVRYSSPDATPRFAVWFVRGPFPKTSFDG